MAGDPRVLIIGAGPTGLGAAWRLQELGHTNWDLYESSDHPGGLASSFLDANGFTWDVGGHVLFSHYRYFDELMVTALGDQWVEHIREAWVWMRARWIPYPFQNNIWRLPEAELLSCLDGLLDIHRAGRAATAPHSFKDWLLATFGPGLCETFMLPYNRKVWAYDPARLDVGWMGERVATVDIARILRNLVWRSDDISWGPNSTFRFPLHGATGAIWRAVCAKLPSHRIHFRRRVVAVEPSSRTAIFDDQSVEQYDHVISTMPLDLLLKCLRGQPALAARAEEFVHSSSHIVGIGMAGQPSAQLKTKCWVYFPETQQPFYRATVFSNYSPNNVPQPGQQWSLMAEVSESVEKPVDSSRIVADVIAACAACGFVDPDRVISQWYRRIEHGYPTPWLGRDRALAEVDEQLRRAGIFSRGRFGAWKYEVSNQDHSLMQGVEVVNHLLRGTIERTYYGHMADDE